MLSRLLAPENAIDVAGGLLVLVLDGGKLAGSNSYGVPKDRRSRHAGSDLFEQLEPFPTCAEFETCAGHEWGAQLPAIAAALRTLPVRSVILDGEGVICGPDGVSDFDRMRAVFSRKGSPDVFLYAFDVLELDGRDLRAQSWDARRALLTQLLDRCQDGLRLSEHIVDTDGAVVFRQACVMGREGIVAKRRDSRYRSGRCREWIKVKNHAHPVFKRAMLIALSKRTGSRSR